MNPFRNLLIPALSLGLAASTLPAHEPDRDHDHHNGLRNETILQLESARQAAARFFDVEEAKRAGYEDIKLFIPHMGWHFLNSHRLNGHFDPAKPELLVYQEDCDGKLRLAAVEYAIPTDLSATAPRGFVGDDDVWFKDEGFNLWTLHAWVYDFNPDGVFAPDNPRLP